MSESGGFYKDFNFADEKYSKVNSGGLINIRLDYLWRESHRHSRLGKYSDWNADLDCVWRELGGEYEENSEENKQFENIDREISKVGVNNWGIHSGFKQTLKTHGLKMTSQYRMLMKKELFLRRLQNKQGKGTAYTDGSEDDWE